MKKLIVFWFLFFSLSVTSFSQSNSNAKPFTLNGKMIGEDNGRLIFQYSENFKWIQDTVIIKNGQFVFAGNIPEPVQAQIVGKNSLNTTSVYLEPGIMDIILTADRFNEFKMTGSKTQDERNELDHLVEQLNIRRQSLHTEYLAIYDSIGKTKDKVIVAKLEKIYDEKMMQNSQIEKMIDRIEINFVLSHPRSYLSSELLMRFDKNEVVSIDSLKSVYNKLDISIQKSVPGLEISKDITKKENSCIGAIAPFFTAIDINNQPLTYFDFKGKNVVLLDFWASWCIPCKQGIPHLKDLFKKYHKKGLEIIAVTQDFNKKAWIAAVKRDSTEIWHQVQIAQRYSEGPAYLTKDDIYENYFVQAIPLQLLIDKKGKIIGRWVSYSIENEEELDKKLAILFSQN